MVPLPIFNEITDNERKYQRSLNKFLDFICIQGISLEAKAKTFRLKAKKDQTWTFDMILSFLCYPKDRVDRREVTGATVRNYVKSIKLFCEIFGR